MARRVHDVSEHDRCEHTFRPAAVSTAREELLDVIEDVVRRLPNRQAPGSSMKRAPGTRSAMKRPCEAGSIRYPVRPITRVGTRIFGNTRRASIWTTSRTLATAVPGGAWMRHHLATHRRIRRELAEPARASVIS
jgi:hypothetical protein